MTNLIPLPLPTETDLVRLERYDSGVRVRALVEMAIVKRLLIDLHAAGLSISIDDGEEVRTYPEFDLDLMVDDAMAVDECHIITERQGKASGVVFLVFGNSGFDVVCDYSTSLNEVLQPANDYADALSAWF